MEIHNSLENELYIRLLSALISSDFKRLWSCSKQMERDLDRVKERTSQEGLSFLTTTLPSLGRAFDKALISGEPFTCPPGFSRRKGQIPKLFGDLFGSLFTIDGNHKYTPEVLANPESTNDVPLAAIYVAAIRQLCYLFYKLEVPYAQSTEERVLNSFVALDQDLPDPGSFDCSGDPILRQARALIERVLVNEDFKDIIPGHGPGSVATGESPRGKSRLRRYYPALESEYPFWEYFRFNAAHVCDTYTDPLVEVTEACAKVTLVPKDSRGPRVISMEPLEIQWIQQGIKDRLYKCIESHPLTAGFVNFTDQSINRNLALEASKLTTSNGLATLDMKDASDRVSIALFQALFSRTSLYGPALAARSTHTRLPNAVKLRLKKFAPMGSALCFPVEALIFWAVSVSIAIVDLNVSRREALKSVWVYGDDVIMPSQWCEHLMAKCENYGLLFNRDKSCFKPTGFRESCGLDAWMGHVVTPLRIKTRFTSNRCGDWIESFVAQSNLAYKRGLIGLAEALEYIVRDHHNYASYIPYVAEEIGCICFVRDYMPLLATIAQDNKHMKRRLKKSQNVVLVRGIRFITKLRKPATGGYEELLRRFARVGNTTLNGSSGSPLTPISTPFEGYADRDERSLLVVWVPLT